MVCGKRLVFRILKFEVLILIMIPIGLVAAFAIAIALMTSVMRKVRDWLARSDGRSNGGDFCL